MPEVFWGWLLGAGSTLSISFFFLVVGPHLLGWRKVWYSIYWSNAHTWSVLRRDVEWQDPSAIPGFAAGSLTIPLVEDHHRGEGRYFLREIRQPNSLATLDWWVVDSRDPLGLESKPRKDLFGNEALLLMHSLNMSNTNSAPTP